MELMAAMLEACALQRCPLLYNRRGKNSKGIVEKIWMSVWGDYYTTVKPTVFHADTRNENEHGAAELYRRGARLCWFNETLAADWSNAVFKNKNSSDPVVYR